MTKNLAKYQVKAPLILWGPYFWCDGLKPRSDGLIWTCCEPTSDVSYNPTGAPGGQPFYLHPNPTKTFCNPGVYTAYLTVTDNSGNAVTREVCVTVTGVAPAPATSGDPSDAPSSGRSRDGVSS